MQVSNGLADESMQYTESRADMSIRSEEIGDLVGIADYCVEIGEPVLYNDDKIWDREVQEGILFWEWLYSGAGEGSHDDRSRMQEFLAKSCERIDLSDMDSDQSILISLGEYANAASCESEYIKRRRDILAGIRDVKEYESFMRTCFRNSVFADDILTEMRYIEDFPSHTREITDSLGVLNDEAVGLYMKYHDNLKKAIDILDKKVLACSADPAHTNKLLFKFTYYEKEEGENIARVKEVTCSPHLKLVRKDSNLRIYFSWRDKDVGKDEKVLIGRIGRHPY